MCLIHVMYQSALPVGRHAASAGGGDLSSLLEVIARCSTRPRYAFMLLTLIADAAGPDGSAGPYVRCGGQEGRLVSLRDWLSDALTPMGQRDHRRQALQERIRSDLSRAGELPSDPVAANAAIETELRDRVRASGKTNLSRAVSELVAAGLLRRHYQGFAVDHHNRGAQRQAVYTLIGLSRTLIAGRHAPPSAQGRVRSNARQAEFAFAR